MVLPQKYLAARDAEKKRLTLDRIARTADRERCGFRFQGTSSYNRTPRVMLVLILVGVVLVGGLFVVTSQHPAARLAPQRKEEVAREDDLRIIANALTLYKLHTGHYPTEAEGGLVALTFDPGCDGWRGPYISHPLDPWGRGYFYFHDPDGDNIPSLFSGGPDKIAGTPDDIHASPEDFEVPQEIVDTWRQKPENPISPTVYILP